MTDQLELASVVEPSSELEITPNKIVITTNLEGVEKHITELLKPFEEGEIDVSTKELETYARVVLADLNKIKEDIATKRKARFKEINQPITEIEDKVKALEARIEAAYRKSKNVIDEKIALLRKERAEELRQGYEGSVGDDIASRIPFDKIANTSWFAPSYGATKALNELAEKCEQIIREMKVIDKAQLVNRNEVIAHYCQNVNLTAALEYDNELTEKKCEADRIAAEAAEAFKMQGHQATLKAAEEPKPKHTPAAKDVEHSMGTFVLTMENVALLDAVEVARYAESLLGFKPELVRTKESE